MVKSEIIKKLHKKYSALNRSQIQDIIDVMFDTITESLIKHKPVELRDFGRFSIKKIKAKYNARNPRTGEIIYVPEKKKVSFKMSKHLKLIINKQTKK
ncbi:integration host factor subunit beta [Pelagibacteraceae bacterium]|nr:integration host factor subunit beta [Pelagibacteraceae bacterium]